MYLDFDMNSRLCDLDDDDLTQILRVANEVGNITYGSLVDTVADKSHDMTIVLYKDELLTYVYGTPEGLYDSYLSLLVENREILLRDLERAGIRTVHDLLFR